MMSSLVWHSFFKNFWSKLHTWATRAATLIAATRLGWVQPTFFPSLQYPASYRYCGICVVFPEPVSPSTMRIWWSSTACKRSSRKGKMGNERLVSCKDIFFFCISDCSGWSIIRIVQKIENLKARFFYYYLEKYLWFQPTDWSERSRLYHPKEAHSRPTFLFREGAV